MATTSVETRPQLAPTVRWLLGSLRTWIRWYVWVEGLACAVAWLGVAFWGTLAIDWFFEPPPAVRVAMLAVVGLVFLGVLVKMIGRRAFVPLTDSNMATLLERRYTQLDDSLLTSVELTGRRPDPAQCNPQMLERTCRQAAQRVREVGLLGVFHLAPLLRSIAAAVLLSGTVVAFMVLFPHAFDTWAERSLGLSSDLWPRQTLMEIEGFKENGVEKVARGADFEVIAKAHTRWPPDYPHGRLLRPIVPQTAQIRYRVEGGRRAREPMNRLGNVRADEDPFQKYSYKFQGVLAPITFSIKGNDHVVGDFRIEVVDSPTIDEMMLDYEYPRYMYPQLEDRQARTFPVTGVMQVPYATRVTVRSRANKDLVRVQIDAVRSEGSLPPTELHAEDLAADRRNFRHTIESLTEDTTLLFTLSDTDGITGREPVRLALVAIPDGPPQLSARLNGIGTAITAMARLPAVGQVTDDYGIDKVWFEYKIDQQDPAEQPIAAPSGDTTEWKLDAVMDANKLELTPGQKLLVSIKAADLYGRYGLGGEPNVGTSERWLLDVVTPEELRAMLEKGELVLRQRFKAIMEEVTETRDLLLRMEFGPAGAVENADETKPPDGSEPGDEPGDEEETITPEQRLTRRTLQAQRALQNSRKNAQETEGVGEAFDDIRLQMINNNIHTEELIIRLEQRIADPLHRIAGEMFPELELSVQQLQEKLADEDPGRQRRDLARQKADDVLLEMEKVLDQMIELEDFNEALELLRTIIKLQEELGEQVDERHKRELLED